MSKFKVGDGVLAECQFGKQLARISILNSQVVEGKNLHEIEFSIGGKGLYAEDSLIPVNTSYARDGKITSTPQNETSYLLGNTFNAEILRKSIEETEALIKEHKIESENNVLIKMIQDLTSTCTSLVERIEKLEQFKNIVFEEFETGPVNSWKEILTRLCFLADKTTVLEKEHPQMWEKQFSLDKKIELLQEKIYALDKSAHSAFEEFRKINLILESYEQKLKNLEQNQLENIVAEAKTTDNMQKQIHQIFSIIEKLDKESYQSKLIDDAHSLRLKELEENRIARGWVINALEDIERDITPRLEKLECIERVRSESQKILICDYCKDKAVYSAIPVSNELGEYFKHGIQTNCPKCNSFHYDNLGFLNANNFLKSMEQTEGMIRETIPKISEEKFPSDDKIAEMLQQKENRESALSKCREAQPGTFESVLPALREGRRIRRKVFVPGVFWSIESDSILCCGRDKELLGIKDVLSTDWEVIE